MKRRVLKPWGEKALTVAGVMLFVLLICVNDFTLKGLFLMVCGWIAFAQIINVLSAYGSKSTKEFLNVSK